MNVEDYKVVDGTHYERTTPNEVVEVLERARRERTRIRVHYGDVQSGRDWMDECDVRGRVGRSMGPVKVPLLLHNSRSIGGGPILTQCVVKVTTTAGNRPLYTHPKYHSAEEPTQ